MNNHLTTIAMFFTNESSRIGNPKKWSWIFCLLFTISMQITHAQADFVITQAANSGNVGDTFTLTVSTQTSTNQQIDLAEVHLLFDPSVLEVTNLTPFGSSEGLSIPLVPEVFDNSAGTIDYAASTFFNFPVASFNFLEIQFTAIGPGTSSLDFVLSPNLPASIMTFEANSVLGTATGASITVGNVNQDPTASFMATPTSGDAQLLVNVDANGSSDPEDGTNLASYSWDFGDGNSDTGITASNTYINPGEYTITLTVTDQDGGTDTATETITVNAVPVNSAPAIAAIADQIVTEGQSLNLSDIIDVSDVDGNLTSVSISSSSTEPQLLESTNVSPQTDPFPFDASGFLSETNTLNTGTDYESDLTFSPIFGDGGGANGDGNGTYDITVTATDADGESNVLTFQLTVLDAPQPISDSGITIVQAESFDNQGGPSGIGVEVNNPGVTNIGFTNNGDFATYQINVLSAGTYDITFNVARNPATAKSMTVKSGGNTLGVVDVSGTGGWQTYIPVLLEDVSLSAGVQTFELVWENAGGNFYFNVDNFQFELVATNSDNVPPTITLIGDNPQELNQGDSYIELGAIANDDLDGDISDNIVIDATAVDMNTVASYNVTYNVSDAANNAATEVIRIVNVVASVNLPPTIEPLVAVVEVDEGGTINFDIQINDDTNPAATIVIYDKSDPTGPNTDPFTSNTQVTGFTFTQGAGGLYNFNWPTSVGDGRSYLARVTADDGVNGAVTQDFTIDIAQDILDGPILAKTFGNPLPWYGPNPNGTLGRNVAIETNTNQNIGYIGPNEFVDYLIDVPAAGPYIFRINASKGNGTSGLLTISEENGGVFSSIGNETINQNGWTTFEDYTIPVVFANAGLQTLRFNFGGGMNIQEFQFTVPSGNLPPVFTTEITDQSNLEGDSPLGLAVAVNDPEGDDVTFSDNGSLPPGLSIDPNTGAISGSIDVGAAANSPYTIEITATDDGNPVESAISTFTWSVNTAVALPLCINSGNQGTITAFGKSFAADQYFGTPSNIFNKLTTSISGTTPNSGEEDLFQSERFGDPLSYAIPTGNGSFSIELYLVELYIGSTGGGSALGTGDRIFAIEIEGNSEETGIDLFDTYGPLVAVTKTFNVTVSDGILNIDLPPSVDNAKLGGICITETANFSPNQAPTVSIDQVDSILDCEGDGEDVTLTASASDAEQGDMSAVIIWKDNADNEVGTGATLELTGFTGTATYTAEVTDATPATATESITVTVIQNMAPTIDPIVATPISITVGSSVSLSTSAADSEDESVTIEWSSDIETVSALGTGESINPTLTVVGTHTISASVTDACNETATVTTTVEVTAASNNPPEFDGFISPEQGLVLRDCLDDGELVNLNAIFTDVEDDASSTPLTIQWFDGTAPLGTGNPINDISLAIGTHEITAVATDSGDESTTSTIQTVEVIGAPEFTSYVGTVGGNPLLNATIDGPDITVCWDVTNLDPGGLAGEHFHLRIDDDAPGQSTGSVNGEPYVRINTASGCFTFTNVSPGPHEISFYGAQTGHNQICEKTIVPITVEDNTIPIITLNGDSTIDLIEGDTYLEQGATADDSYADGDLTESIVVGGDVVDTVTPDSYVLTYDVSDAAGNDAIQVTRTVNVSTAPVTNVFFVVNPETSNVTEGATFSVVIEVQANDQQIDLAEVHLTFDPTIVEVSGLTTGTTLPAPLVPPVFDNTLGAIDYSAGITSNFPSGTFDLLTIEFEAVGSGSTNLSFVDPDGPASTTATFGAANVLTGTTGGLINIPDVTPPTIACPEDQTISLDEFCSTTIPDFTGLATVSDNQDLNPSLTQSPLPGTVVNGADVIVIILTATDAANNTNTCSFNLAVEDMTAPILVCGGNFSGDSPSGLPLVFEIVPPSVTDNCDATPSLSGLLTFPDETTLVLNDQTASFDFPPGTSTVLWTSLDDAGNPGTCSQTVTVNFTPSSDSNILVFDITNQVGNTTIDGTNINILMPIGTNLSSLAPTISISEFATVNPASGDLVDFSQGAVNYAVTAQNNSQTVYSVLVENEPDIIPPVITLLGADPVELNVGDVYTDAGATALDNLDGNITTSIVTVGDVIDTNVPGMYTVTYNVSDLAGNPA
ncbi:immunoglobulin-like domain-containing protein, partial [Croceitalea rosinachiae]